MSLSSSASDIFVACGFFAPAPRRVARVINLTLFISAPASSTSQSAAASSGPIQLYTNPLPLRRWSWPTCHASGSEQSKHIGETDCVAGVVGFELRCAERKFISLARRAVSDSSASAETAAVPRENDLLC